MRAVCVTALSLVLVLSAIPLLAESNAAVEKALESKEQAGWQAWKDHDAKAIEGMIPEQSINITGGGVDKGKQAVVKSIGNNDCKVNSFSLSDFSYIWMSKDAVIMTYTANQDATCNGQKIPGKVVGSSVWQKKDGKWISPFHQETVAHEM